MMKKIVSCIILLVMINCISNAKELKYNSNQYYVKFKKEFIDNLGKLNANVTMSLSEFAQSIAPLCKVKGNLLDKFKQYYTLVPNGNINKEQFYKLLINSNLIELIEPVPQRQLFFVPDDPLYNPENWSTLVAAEEAWSVFRGNPNVLIGIVDSGVELSHDDLRSQVYINPNEIEDGIDNDGNGLIDDITGWDFVGDISLEDTYNGIFKADNEVSPNNIQNAHGTLVAGVAVASSNNSVGISSIAFNSRFVPVKIAADNMNPSNGGVPWLFQTFEGIIYAASIGCKIINCSWGGGTYSVIEQEIINGLYEDGVQIVAASGNIYGNNSMSPVYPACYDNVLQVGATNNVGSVAFFTNHGNRVDIFAPGANVLTTTRQNTYIGVAGTSFSAPMVASSLALVYGRLLQQGISDIKVAKSSILAENNIRNYLGNNYNILRVGSAIKSMIPNIEISKYSYMGEFEKEIIVERANQSFDIELHISNPFGAPAEIVSVDCDNCTLISDDLDFYFNNATEFSIPITIQFSRLPEMTQGHLPLTFEIRVATKTYKIHKNILYKRVSNNRLVNLANLNYGTPIGIDYVGSDVYVSSYLGNKGYTYSLNYDKTLTFNKPVVSSFSFKDTLNLIASSPEFGRTEIRKIHLGVNRMMSLIADNTPFLNKIYARADGKYTILGDKKQDGKFAQYYSYDGRYPWDENPNTLDFLDEEHAPIDSYFCEDDFMCFSTNQSRFFYSNDYGDNWQVFQLENNIRLKRPLLFNGKIFALTTIQTFEHHLQEAIVELDYNSQTTKIYFNDTLQHLFSQLIHDKSNNRLLLIMKNGAIYDIINSVNYSKSIASFAHGSSMFHNLRLEGQYLAIYNAALTSLSKVLIENGEVNYKLLDNYNSFDQEPFLNLENGNTEQFELKIYPDSQEVLYIRDDLNVTYNPANFDFDIVANPDQLSLSDTARFNITAKVSDNLPNADSLVLDYIGNFGNKRYVFRANAKPTVSVNENSNTRNFAIQGQFLHCNKAFESIEIYDLQGKLLETISPNQGIPCKIDLGAENYTKLIKVNHSNIATYFTYIYSK